MATLARTSSPTVPLVCTAARPTLAAGTVPRTAQQGRSVRWNNSSRGSSLRMRVVTGPTAPLSATGQEAVWEASFISTAVLDADEHAGVNIQIVVVDRDSEARSPAISLDDVPWGKKPKEGPDGLVRGWTRVGPLSLPASIKTPGALLITKKLGTGQEGSALDYIAEITLRSSTGQEIELPVHSWISSEHGERIFFDGKAFLPKDTPKSLTGERQRDLQSLRGTKNPTSLNNRSYGYQVYDDLGSAKEPRPTLGGSTTRPYPRHQLNVYDKEQIAGPGKPWIPYDEEFDYRKEAGFSGGTLLGLTQLLACAIGNRVGLRPNFRNYEDVYGVFYPDGGVTGGRTRGSLLPDGTDNGTFDFKADDDLLKRLEQECHIDSRKVVMGPRQTTEAIKKVEEAEAGSGNLAPAADKKADPGALSAVVFAAQGVARLLFDQIKKGGYAIVRFDVPRVMAGRQDQWETDNEYGRQFLAGENPCTIEALTQLPAEKCGSAIQPTHVDDELKALGSSKGLAELVADAAAGAKPRVYWVDYWYLDTFWDEGAVQKNRAEHAGRILLYLTQSAEGEDTGLIPLAIELKSRNNSTKEARNGVVFARQELAHDPQKKVLWQLAKTVFRSCDSAVHQLVSHWLRTHCCLEPFLLAMRRQISALHPVYKLMLPHFRYTMDINMRARGSLINADGIIEKVFTPGKQGLSLSAAAYASWRFHKQALPEDLKARGMVDKNGKPWLDYPYADDGLDLWAELHSYFTSYLGLYYKGDDDVRNDAELKAWWEEAKNEGHPDMKLVEKDEKAVWGFEGPIATVDQLVHVLTTIAWTASAHHAAVNFGQYDFSGLLLNTTPMIRKPIPDPNNTQSEAYKALVEGAGGPPAAVAVAEVVFNTVWQAFWAVFHKRPAVRPVDTWNALKSAASGRDKQEREFLTYIASPQQFLQELVTLKLLSTHAEGEQFLDLPNVLITDPAAVAENKRFIQRMAALDDKFEARNNEPKRWTRVKGQEAAMPYTLLQPSSEAGLTFRGVPYSVSI